MIGVYNHLLRKVFRFHYHSQKVIGSLGNVIKPLLAPFCSPGFENCGCRGMSGALRKGEPRGPSDFCCRTYMAEIHGSNWGCNPTDTSRSYNSNL